MWTIIWIGLGWLALSVLMAWVWHRLRAVEYRAEYTLNERDKDWEEEKLELARRLLEGWTDSSTFTGMDEADKVTMDDLVEGLARIFAKDDQPEASPEDREYAKSIKEMAAELVFGAK
jgi:hypothetical protein